MGAKDTRTIQNTKSLEKSTSVLTQEYIRDHPYILSCLKDDLINFSSLSRKISKDLGIEKKTSMEAILVAARRFQETLKKDSGKERDILALLSHSELEVKNKIAVFIIARSASLDSIDDIQKAVRKDFGTFFLLEGSSNYTLITQDKHAQAIEHALKSSIIKREKDLALIILKSAKEIESTIGVVAYLTSLFAENGVNILEFLSCWKDTLFVIESKDVNKALGFLKF